MADATVPEHELRAFIARTEQRLKALEDRPPLVRHRLGNLVKNGTFDTDTTNWSAVGSGDITFASVSGALEITRGAGGINGRPEQLVDLVTGAKYRTGAGFTGANGQVVHFGTGSGTSDYSAVTQSAPTDDLFTALGDLAYVSTWGNASATSIIDDIRLHEVDPSDDAPWLRLPRGFKVGDHGMIFRDGTDFLMADDFEEIPRGDQYFIKPVIAPGASTEFEIFAYRE